MMAYYEYLYINMFYVITLVTGLIVILAGILFTPFSPSKSKVKTANTKKYLQYLGKTLNKATSFSPLKQIRDRINDSLKIALLEEKNSSYIASALAIALVTIGLLLAAILFSMGQLWYSKIMLSVMGLVLPLYAATLLLDLYRHRITRQIPELIDEFRSSFIRHNKIRPALKECSRYIDRRLGRIILRASDSVFLEDNLNSLKQRFNDVWFNIFVVLIINFKENGGQLIDQLYKLNRTMTRYNAIEHKKSKRLIWYEVFAIAAAFLSIPAIFWMNSIILGSESTIVDTKTNMMISQVMLFSALSLIIVRVLRKT